MVRQDVRPHRQDLYSEIFSTVKTCLAVYIGVVGIVIMKEKYGELCLFTSSVQLKERMQFLPS